MATPKVLSVDLLLACRAAKLEGDAPQALRQAVSRARRIQIAWLLCNVASGILCACMGALEGWAQLQLCCIAALWLAGTSTLLEYLMACIVHRTTETHLAAMHSLVRHPDINGACYVHVFVDHVLPLDTQIVCDGSHPQDLAWTGALTAAAVLFRV